MQAVEKDETNPWRTVTSRQVYTNPWITVREDKVICPDGSDGIYGVFETKIATGVVALTPANEMYLVGQYRYPLDCYSWEIPEGGAERGEDPLKAIQRELQEEAGVRAKTWFQMGSEVHLSNCFTNERAILYFARDLEAVSKNPDHTEVLKVRCIPFDDAVTMALDGTITDAMSIIAILLASRVLGGRDELLRSVTI